MSNQYKLRIDGREQGDALLGMLCENMPEPFIMGVLNACEAFVKACREQDSSGLLVMSEEQAKAYEAELLGFGVHKGKPIGEAPIEYLTWVADQSVKLQSYLRSDRGRARIESEEA